MSHGQETSNDASVATRQRHILIVDDDPVLQVLLPAVLEKAGYLTQIVEDGAAALGIAANFDLVLIDLHMPVMDGVETTRRIRADAAASHVAIVAMSADSSTAELERCLAAGIDEFLTKPFDLEVLLSSVERLTAVADTRRTGG